MVSASHTSLENKADHVSKMGEEIGLIYDALWQEIAWIHKKWAEYVALFGTTPERIELLNQAAPSFFRTAQDSMWEDVLLHLARLTDSPRSMGKNNLSMKRLSAAVANSPIYAEIAELVETAQQRTEFARDWRNRKLAHRDLDLVLGRHVEPLAPASRAAVKDALTTLAAVLNVVSGHYLDSTTMFELGSNSSDAVSLLYVVRDGLRHDEERRERIKRGECRPDDLRHRPI